MRIFGIGGVLSLVSLLSCSQLVLMAQPSLAYNQRTNGSAVREAFVEQQAELQKVSAVLYERSKNFNYGVVVSEDGYILAKASELEEREDLSVRIGDVRYSEVQVLAHNPRWDLALLKVDAVGLQSVRWAASSALPQGSWVVANGATNRRARRINVGIISAKPRAVDGRASAVIGVSFKAEKGSLEIELVTPETGAEEAGLKKGDVLKKFAGEVITSRESLIERVRDFMPGEKVALEFERKGELLQVEVELMARSKAYEENKSRNDAMSGDYSERRDSFPRVMQTDIPFSARNVGGPLLDLNSECVGMNIARANRAESFAIPVEELREELADLLEQAK